MHPVDRVVSKLALPLVVLALAGVTGSVLAYEFWWRPAHFEPGAKVFNITFMGTDRWTLNRVGSWNYWRKGLGDLREIHVRQGDRVLFRLISSDVTHGFALPAYGIRGVSVAPGDIAEVKLAADKPGRFLMFCDRYCGPTHSDMRALFVVEPRPAAAGGPQAAYAAAIPSPVARGRAVFSNYGCWQCHGKEGRGGVVNLNSQGGEVPALTHVADSYSLDDLKSKILQGVPEPAKADPRGSSPPLYMPPWKGIIAKRDLRDLAAYLMSLSPADAKGGGGW